MTVEVNELRESARQVMAGLGTPAAEGKTWKQAVELGWLMVSVPEALGGLDLGVRGACAIQTELGAALCAAPYLPQLLALEALCASSLSDRDAWLERLMSGEGVSTSLGVCAVDADAENCLTGSLSAVQSVDSAEHLLVWTAKGNCVALVGLNQSSVRATEKQTWDSTRRLYDVRLDNADAQVLASGDEAVALTSHLLNVRDVMLAADAVGGANALLAMTVEHLQVRHQFGRPLAMFQALKHRCADLKAMVSAAEALLNHALGQLDSVGGSRAASEAKYLASHSFYRVAEEALQLHGGIGMASEHDCHLFLKRALLGEHLGRGVDNYPQEIAEAFLQQKTGS